MHTSTARIKNNQMNQTSQLTCFSCGVSCDRMYCTNACKIRAWRQANPDAYKSQRLREKKHKRPATVCKYYATYCGCGEALGSRSNIKQCASCRKSKSADEARTTARRLHALDGRVIECDECKLKFCPVYGSSHARLCVPCVASRESAARATYRLIRKARIRAAAVEPVNPIAVFDRAHWHCQLCGVATPRSSRGTYSSDAPELDHIIPLSKGGSHSYANTQCACRSCNGLKSDTIGWKYERHLTNSNL